MTLSIPVTVPTPGRGFAALYLVTMLLSACQHGADRPALSRAAKFEGWKVVERLGDVRYLPPSASAWVPVMSGSPLPYGSQVATGHGGRLILASRSAQVSAGTNSRFVLADPSGDDRVQQSSGRLSYRIGDATVRPVSIETPFLNLEATASVFNVAVTGTETAVTVEHGEIAVTTPNDTRRADLRTGQSAIASDGAETQLAIRSDPRQRFEPVKPATLPATYAKPTETVELEAVSTPNATNPAIDSQPHHSAMAAVSRGLKGTAAQPGVSSAQTRASTPLDRVEDSHAAVDPATDLSAPPASDRPVDELQQRFDRLIDGLLDQVPAARPAG